MDFFFRIAAALIIAGACTVTPAFAAQQMPGAQQLAALMKPITTAFNAADAGNVRLFRSQYAPGSTIADEFAPFVWTGPNAPDHFFADFGKAIGEYKMTNTKLTAGRPKYAYVAGPRAYVVLPVRVSAGIAGRPYSESGWMTITLRQVGGVWKVATQSWTKGTESFNPY